MEEGEGLMEMREMVGRSQANRAQDVFLLTTGWTKLTEYTALIVLRSCLSLNPTDGMGVFTSTVTYFIIKKKKSTHLLAGINLVRLLDILGYIPEGSILH